MRTDLVLRSWWRTRRAMHMSSAALKRRRSRQWRALQPALSRTPATASLAGRSLHDFPITDVDELRADYGNWNSLGYSDQLLRAAANAAECGENTGELAAGWSSGSGGGSRGLFLTSVAERADYIGQSLARLLPPRALLGRQRIALMLRANSPLYSDVQGRRIAFMHLPLDRSDDEAQTDLRRFDPTILIATPSRLLELAATGKKLPNLRHLFFGSEPMSEAECDYVASRLGLAPRAIYQATEGFLGASCGKGRLHLNDHALEIEAEPVPGTTGFRPIITDLRRRSQPIVRLRGDDYLEFDDNGPCPCGYSGRTIRPVAGRVHDIWRFGAQSVTPHEVQALVEAELGGDIAWQASANAAQITLRANGACSPGNLAKAADRLRQQIGKSVNAVADLPAWTGTKRHKVIWAND